MCRRQLPHQFSRFYNALRQWEFPVVRTLQAIGNNHLTPGGQGIKTVSMAVSK